MRKRFLLILLALLLIFSFSACAQESNENSEWIWVGLSSSKQGVLTADGYYYIDRGNSLLSYADLSGSGKIVLCSKVGCQHKSLECEAYIQNWPNSPMFFWEDHVYYVDEMFTYSLYRRDATGAAQMKIGTPTEKYIEEGKASKIQDYLQVGEYLYYCAQITSAGRDEEGTNISLSESNCIGRIHLTSGKDEILVEQSTKNNGASLRLYAAKSDGVLYGASEGVDLSADDPGFAEAYRQSAVTLNCWNEGTGEITQLVTKPKRELNEVQLVQNGKIYYCTQVDTETRNKGNIYTYDLSTGKEELVFENASLYHYGGGFAWHETNESDNQMLINLQTGEVLPMELFIRPLLYARSDSGVVVSKFVKDEERPTSIKETIYCYVAYKSMADGLQESDLIPLYTVKSGYS